MTSIRISTRYRPLAWLLVVFLAVEALTRLVLLVKAGPGVPASPGTWLSIFLIGLGYDLLTFVYFAWPLVLLLWVLPKRWFTRRRGRWPVTVLGWLLVATILFIAVAEWTFWEEFQTRFNFIAVDYLVYTTEVIGNIRESYPVPAILSVLFLLTCVLCWWGRRWLVPQVGRQAEAGDVGFGRRSLFTLGWLVATVLGTWFVNAGLKNHTDNEYVNTLSGNGTYQFFAAYRNASIDYARFYRTEPVDEAFKGVRGQLQSPDSRFVNDNPYDLTREITAHQPERKLNVVLISVESLSASFSKDFGGDDLTPNLDRLAKHSLVFDNLYANGTRTVRGLEALSLSVPPTPGDSIVKRPHNEGLFSLASVFNRKGYVSEFLYGGYGTFDNMNYFFAHNGYIVKDREAIADDKVHASNVWGVADEDLYTLAMSEFDRIHAGKRPFFAHIMTTSNHRPYTFPTGRIDEPQGERASAVVYTDWAIADFIKRARTKPWFADTVFVVTADHCASSGGIAALPTYRYHIPLWIYSPAHIKPQRVERMISQIDIAPTLLGLLGFSYNTRFYGQDALVPGTGHERAFIGNYQKLGYLKDDRLVELGPNQTLREVKPDFHSDNPQPEVPTDPVLAREAVRYYQTASFRFKHGLMGVDTSNHAAADKIAAGAGEPAGVTGKSH